MSDIDLKDAYKVLGVREGASKAEIEKRFAMILKKHRMQISTGEQEEGASGINMEEATRAYNLLMGYEEKEPEQAVMRKPNPLLKKLGIDEKKAENFWHYYKFHVLGGILLIIILASTLKSCITRVEPDLNVAFVGEFLFGGTEGFEKLVEDKLGNVRKVGVDSAVFFPGMDGQMEVAMHTKTMVLFAAADVDLFVLDRANFEKFGKQGAFMKLDELSGSLDIGSESARNKTCALKAENDDKEYVYGIDVTDSPIFSESGIEGKEKIAAISIRAKRGDKALELLGLLLE